MKKENIQRMNLLIIEYFADVEIKFWTLIMSLLLMVTEF